MRIIIEKYLTVKKSSILFSTNIFLPLMVKAPPDHIPMAVDSQDSSSSISIKPITSPNQLPVHSMRKKIVETVFNNDCCIFLGETGCGKTTQIPRFLYEAREKKQNLTLNKKSQRNKNLICCTQPRRVAAISVAERVASEINQKCGELIGYSVRFDESISRRTRIKYMTDGMLLREALIDPYLRQYSIIILDEAHERTLHTDLLFGIVKQALNYRKKSKKRPLHVLIMSATMNVDLFSNYFNQAPVLYLQGRQYPIDVFHVQDIQTDYIHASLITLFQVKEKKF
jgi:ATP-dependent RNA helicase DHX33